MEFNRHRLESLALPELGPKDNLKLVDTTQVEILHVPKPVVRRVGGAHYRHHVMCNRILTISTSCMRSVDPLLLLLLLCWVYINDMWLTIFRHEVTVTQSELGRKCPGFLNGQ